jgi:hypothetical protein
LLSTSQSVVSAVFPLDLVFAAGTDCPILSSRRATVRPLDPKKSYGLFQL